VFDWSIYFNPVLPQWSIEDKVVLVGDSCHATTPFVGQGANQAIADAYSLAGALPLKLALRFLYLLFQFYSHFL
jgi:salicylate hydroxylase